MMTDLTQQRQLAADHAVAYVQSDMIVGLGTGSTATLFVRRLAERLQQGDLCNIWGIPTSVTIENEAKRLGIPLTNLEEHPVIDMTVDGADEVDPALNLIKGGGGALLREKIVAQASRREIIIVDEAKLSPVLGTRWHVPIEVIPFGWRSQANFLESLGARVTLRTKNNTAFTTDQGNYILDCHFGLIAQPAALADQIKCRVGIVEHGLFVGLASEVLVGSSTGLRQLTPTSRLG